MLNFLLNILFAVLAFLLVRWVIDRVFENDKVAIVVGLIAAILTFVADLAAHVIR